MRRPPSPSGRTGLGVKGLGVRGSGALSGVSVSSDKLSPAGSTAMPVATGR